MSTDKPNGQTETQNPVGSSEIVGCEFFWRTGDNKKATIEHCGRRSYWKWTHYPFVRQGGRLVPASIPKISYYCREHGDGMRGEGKCADSGKWEILKAANIVQAEAPEN